MTCGGCSSPLCAASFATRAVLLPDLPKRQPNLFVCAAPSPRCRWQLQSTARDVAQLVAYALRRWPLFRAIVSTKQHTCHARALPARVVASNSRKYPHAVTWSNTNALLNTKVYGKAPGARARRPPRGARRRRPTYRSSSSSSVGTATAGAGPDGSAGAAAGDSGDDTAGGGGGGDSSSVLRAPSSSGHSGGSVEATFVFHGVKTVSSALRRPLVRVSHTCVPLGLLFCGCRGSRGRPGAV